MIKYEYSEIRVFARSPRHEYAAEYEYRLKTNGLAQRNPLSLAPSRLVHLPTFQISGLPLRLYGTHQEQTSRRRPVGKAASLTPKVSQRLRCLQGQAYAVRRDSTGLSQLYRGRSPMRLQAGYYTQCKTTKHRKLPDAQSVQLHFQHAVNRHSCVNAFPPRTTSGAHQSESRRYPRRSDYLHPRAPGFISPR